MHINSDMLLCFAKVTPPVGCLQEILPKPKIQHLCFGVIKPAHTLGTIKASQVVVLNENM